MSDQMHVIPFDKLMTWILAEYRQEHTIFGIVPRPARHAERPVGPAAGPHTQLAQNIIAAYAAGGRFFELKTVQALDGDDLKIAKPCISIPDEGYNVEWSTELRVPDAFDEYVKAWIALHVLAKEFALGSPDSFFFQMSVGYDLDGIQSAKIDAFIEGLKDASQTAIWQECRQVLSCMAGQFHLASLADIEQISPRICSSIALSTLHGCPSAEIEQIAAYLLTEKKLDTFVKCNPTLLGYPFVRSTLDQMGYGQIPFDDHHFLDDLQFEDAVPMIRRLQAVADAAGMIFGVKLSNTLPVENRLQQLPGSEMYLSGRALYPLTINLAARLAEAFDGRIRISYSGGADAFNIELIHRTGVWPVTVATTLLKPGGVARLTQLAEQLAAEPPVADSNVIDMTVLRQLADRAILDPDYHKKKQRSESRKLDLKVPLLDCFIAPCKHGCPFGQDAPEYIRFLGEGRYLEALTTIIAKNPLPWTTGTYCDHRCMTKCTRIDYDEAIDIRGAKLAAVQLAFDELVANQKMPTFDNPVKAACLGGTPAGLTAAWFLCRSGIETTVFEQTDAIGNLGGPVSPAFRQAVERDLVLLRKAGIRFNTDVETNRGLTEKKLSDLGYRHLYDARAILKRTKSIADGIAEGIRFAEAVIRRETGKALDLSYAAKVDPARQHQEIVGKKGWLQKPGDPAKALERCLECQAICNVCVEVCPNRANILIHVHSENMKNPNQIIHLDGPCNACGNCATFCPYDSAPYRDKFTLYWTEEDFSDSPNDGFVLLDRDPPCFAVRLGGVTYDLRLDNAAGESRNADIPEPIVDLVRTIARDCHYLLL